MTNTNVFALRATGLEPFLFAEVGIERNGASLTMLSLLARLGEDPWAEAARWASMPKAALLDTISAALARNPTTIFPETEAREAAARLARLLPAAAPAAGAAPSRAPGAGLAAGTAMSPWLKLAALSSALALGIAVNLARAPAEPAATPAAASTALAQAERPTVPHTDVAPHVDGAGPTAAHPAAPALTERHVSL